MSKKGEARIRKAAKLRNKKLIERYPWIRPVSMHGDKIKEYSFTMYDDVPKGWRKAFGRIMLEDYRDILIRNNYLEDFQWIEVKEKYGTLRLYSNPAPNEVLELEYKYDYISGYFCISCGRMNVPMLTEGWVEPLCEDCYNKRIALKRQWYEKNYRSQEFAYRQYRDVEKENQEISMTAVHKCFSPECGNYEKKCDYSDIINKIIERQNKLFIK